MACSELWNTNSDESFSSHILSENDLMDSTKALENKEAECIFCNGKFFEDDQREIWIMCFSCSLWVHLNCTEAENAEHICDFYK